MQCSGEEISALMLNTPIHCAFASQNYRLKLKWSSESEIDSFKNVKNAMATVLNRGWLKIVQNYSSTGHWLNWISYLVIFLY
jgi:hypothetical protein